MNLDWLWQGLASTAVWEILLVLGGAAVLGYVKQKAPEHAPTLGYAALGALCVAILLFTFTGRPLLVQSQPTTTPDNVEEHIKKWADSLGLGVARDPSPSQDVFFGLVVTLKNGNAITVARTKAIPDYLQFQIQLNLSPDHQAIFSKLTKDQAKTVTEEVMLELARAKVGNFITLGSPQTGSPITQSVLVVGNTPIEGLTKDEFIREINDIDEGVTLTRAATELALGRMQPLALHSH